jgi:uncharacterized protein YjdB
MPAEPPAETDQVSVSRRLFYWPYSRWARIKTAKGARKVKYIFAPSISAARRWTWLIFLPALAVCSGATTTETTSNPPGTVSDLSVSATSDVSATLTFTQVDDGRGQAASYDARYAVAPMEWGSASNSSSGTCTAPIAGTAAGNRLSCTITGLSPATSYNFQVLSFRGTLNVDATFGGLSNIAAAATAATSPPPPVVTTVTVTPVTASVAVGATATLQAIVKDALGNVMTGQTVAWSSDASAASVNPSGLVTGVAAGSATITATSSGKTGTATVTVTAAPPPPGLLFQENFEDANIASRGWYDNTSVLLNTTEHIAGSNSSAQYRYLAGAQQPTTGGAQRHKFTATSSLYISYYVKYSANWVGSNQTYHPHEFYAMSNLDGDFDGPANAYMTIYLEQNYQNGGKPAMYIQDNKSINTTSGALPNNLVGSTENRSTSGCNGIPESVSWSVVSCYNAPPWYNAKGMIGPVTFQPNAGAGYKNNWNFVEAYYQLNTIVNGIGQHDGVMQYWFNGALIIDRHDVVYRTGTRPTLMFSQFLIAPYIGDGSPVDQSMFIDNLRVGTARLP